MGSYVKRLDEIQVDPPYHLGMAATPYRYRSHGFFLPVSRDALVEVTNTYLKEPLPEDAPVEFVVLPGPGSVLVAFNCYGRAESIPEPGRGWMGYTEVFFAHPVLKIDKSGLIPTAQMVWHLPLIYIDGVSNTADPDPGIVAILLGREIFGFPKNPGAISYEPGASGDLTTAELRIFDYGPLGADPKLELQRGLRVTKAELTGAPTPPGTTGPPPGGSGGELLPPYNVSIETVQSFLGQALGIRPEEVGTDFLHRAVGEPFSVRAYGISFSFVWGLQLFSPLVSLKQIRHARHPAVPEAAYQAVVETRLWNRGGSVSMPSDSYELDFPALNRLGGARLCGWMGKTNQKHAVPPTMSYFWDAELDYADPEDTIVWSCTQPCAEEISAGMKAPAAATALGDEIMPKDDDDTLDTRLVNEITAQILALQKPGAAEEVRKEILNFLNPFTDKPLDNAKRWTPYIDKFATVLKKAKTDGLLYPWTLVGPATLGLQSTFMTIAYSWANSEIPEGAGEQGQLSPQVQRIIKNRVWMYARTIGP
jgi:hypothetical protein